MTSDLLTIGQMCVKFDVTARALRFYESKELLFPIRKGSQRRYTHSDQVRTKLILRGKRFEFSLEEIRILLDLYDRGDKQQTQLKETYRLAQLHLAEMITRHQELGSAIADLQDDMSIVLEKMQRTPAMT
jgi:DNA-binding transcriptional MerR regulator